MFRVADHFLIATISLLIDISRDQEHLAQNLFLNFLMVDLRDVFVPHDLMHAMRISNVIYDTKFQM